MRFGKQSSLEKNLESSDVVNSMTDKEMRRYANKLFSAANKRLKRLEEKGIQSPAIKAYDIKGKFSTKGLDRNKLYKEVVQATQFLKAKTSTVSGYNATIAKYNKALGLTGDDSLTGEDLSKFWEVFYKFMEKHPSLYNFNAKGSDPAMKAIVAGVIKKRRTEGVNVSNTLKALERWYQKEYGSKKKEIFEKEHANDSGIGFNPFEVEENNSNVKGGKSKSKSKKSK